MHTKHIVAGMALLGTIVTGVVGSVQRTAHAGTSIYAHRPCYVCRELGPSIAVASMYQNDQGYPTPDGGTAMYSTFNFSVTGSAFPEGDAVHIDLIYTLPDGITTPDGTSLAAGPFIAASDDTRVSYERTYPLGNGQYIHTKGGIVSALLTSSPICESPFVDLAFRPSYQVVATDLTTGHTYATRSADLPYTSCTVEYPVTS